MYRVSFMSSFVTLHYCLSDQNGASEWLQGDEFVLM